MKGRYCQLTRYQMLRWIHFLRDILPVLTKLSKLTQRDSLTIVDLKKGVDSTLQFLESLKVEKGEEEKTWIKQVHATNEGKLCWPGKDGHYLRSFRSKRTLLKEEQLAQEQGYFEDSRYEYIKAITEDIKMRFTDLTDKLEDFLVLHNADQKGAEEKLMSLTKRMNKPGFTFKSLMQQWKIWEPILRENPISDSKSLRHTVNLAIEHDRTMSNIPLIRMLYTMYILLPLSTASCERGFSSMNYIKSKRRNKLQENTLRYCIIISNHRWSEGALNFRAIADEIYMTLKNQIEPKRYTLDDLMESLENKKKKKKKKLLACKVAKEVHAEQKLKESVLKKTSDVEVKLRQSFQADDQMLWGETVDRCIQSARTKIGMIDKVHTIIAPVDAL